jgi:site-specific DNA-methyltransferase (adenine-specific)
MLNKIICADVLDGINTLNDNSIHLTFTSPPYNVNLDYLNYEDNLSYSKYLNWLKKIFTLIFEKTVNGGRVAINIDAITNREKDKEEEYVRAIYPHLYEIMKEIGWNFRTEICWLKSEAVGRKTAWGSYMSASNPVIRRNHEYILLWSKGDWKLENDISSDMTKEEFELWTLSTWSVRPETRKRCGHPAPFSEELAKRVIKLFSFPGQNILDPFSGTGTTCKIAYVYNRNYIGIDNSRKYCDYAEKRIDEVEQEKQITNFDKKKREEEKDIFLQWE